MARPRSPIDADDLVQRYQAGEPLQAIAEHFSVKEGTVDRALRRAGVIRNRIGRPSPRRITLDMDALVARYRDGEAVLSLAHRFGVSRAVIDRHLREAGISRRTASEQGKLRMGRLTPAERIAMTERAHEAKRGRPNPTESLVRAAQTRQRLAQPANDAERSMSRWLTDRGMPVVPQVAIERYNVDLAARPVAVEIFGGNWHASGAHLMRAPGRCEHILNEGWSVVFVWDQTRCPMRVEAADYVIAFYEAARRNPSLIGQYRVIRGDGKVLASGSGKPDYGAFVPSQCKC